MKRAVLAIIAMLIVMIAGFFVYGLSQMGDCFPGPDVWAECMAAKARTGNIVLAITIAICLATLWLIFRRRKAR